MKRIIQFLPLVLMIVLISSCSQQNNLAKYNLAPNYTDQFPDRFINQKIYHVNDTLSELSIRIIPALIPNLKAKRVELYSYLTLTYSVYSSMSKKDIVQTNTYKLTDFLAYEDMEGGVIKLAIPLKLIQNQNYIVLVSVQNPVDKQNFLKYHQVFKTKSAPENYRILNEKDEIIWTSWIAEDQKIKIQYRYKDSANIMLSYFKPEFGPALPPFSDQLNKDLVVDKPFEQFKLQLKNGMSSLIELPREGLYKISSSKNDKEGKTIVKLYDDYPSVVSESQKVFGLRYLTPYKEFSLMLKDDPSHTIQEFWFFEDRTKERSQEMMRTYYARMLRANRLFTTYKEGWKTDRGMVFMIYGPPDQVYYDLGKETWEYGPDASYNDLKFVFHKTSNIHTQNAMILERGPEFKYSWYTLLDNWRNQ